MKLTEFGLCVRKLRLELGITLKDMATALSVSSPYLSSVELGEKSLSQKIADQTVNFFQSKIDQKKLEALMTSCAQSMKAVPVSMLEADDRSLVAAFARRLSEGQGVPDDVITWINLGGDNGSKQK